MTDTIVSFVGGVSGASVIGSSHVGQGKPNQDAVGWKQVRLWTFLAVADGHGSAPHYRSDRGSRFAVDTLLTAFEAITHNGTLREPNAIAASVSGLAEQLVGLWRARVDRDIACDPIPESPGFRSHSVYGTTCLGAAVGPGVSLMVQIGDGGLYVGTASDDVQLLFPSDDLDGEQTYSLCLPDAAQNMKIGLYTAPNRLCAPDFILSSTDGLIKSFGSDAAVLDTVRHFRGAIRENGLHKIVAELETWLSTTSERGSGDDMSVAIFTTAVEHAHAPSKPPEDEAGPAAAAGGTIAADAKFGRKAMIAAAAAGALAASAISIIGTLRFMPHDAPPASAPLSRRPSLPVERFLENDTLNPSSQRLPEVNPPKL